MRAQVVFEREAFAAVLKLAHEGFLAAVHKMMPFQLGSLDKRASAFRAHVQARSVRLQVLSHGAGFAKELRASLKTMRSTSSLLPLRKFRVGS